MTLENERTDASSIALIVPAAGSGRRLGSDVPKALADVAGIPLVGHTLRRLAAACEFRETVVLAPAGSLEAFTEALEREPPGLSALTVVAGGRTRQESVYIGLDTLASKPDLVCIHDAARPLVSAATVSAVVAEASRGGAAIAASRPVDSIREDTDRGGSRALERSRLWLVETPQVFDAEVLRAAHASARAHGMQATDDAALVERHGHAVALVASEGRNLKVTEPADLELVRLLLAG